MKCFKEWMREQDVQTKETRETESFRTSTTQEVQKYGNRGGN